MREARWHVVENGSGPPLVLLHGFTGSAGNWQPVLAAFDGFRTIAVDIVGHGRSPAPSILDAYRIDRAADALLATLAHLDALPCHLLGYSMGGRLALYTAVHHPTALRSLILESASPGLDNAAARAERAARDNQLADFIEHAGIVAFVARWESLPLWASQQHLPQPVRERLRRQRLRNNPTGLASSLRGMGTGQQPSLWPLLDRVTLPTLLLTGALDTKFVQIGEEMARALQQARLEIVPGAGHTIHLERPSRFTELVLQFLAEN